MTRIVILGGGFAGLRAAMYFDKDLARRSEIEVTLINRENYTLFTPMLHEVDALPDTSAILRARVLRPRLCL